MTASASPDAAAPAPATASSQKWLAVAITIAVTSTGYVATVARTQRHGASEQTIPATTHANATWPLGSAAYGLWIRSTQPPSTGPESILGGAVGASR